MKDTVSPLIRQTVLPPHKFIIQTLHTLFYALYLKKVYMEK
jgi:hypothetical protein